MNKSLNVGKQYDQYFSSRLYSQRYPCPNWSNFSIIVKEMNEGKKHLLDFGCGSGRYTTLLLERTDATIVAYDISPAAIAELASQCASQVETGRLRTVCGDLPMLMNRLHQDERFDLVMMMFGVLSHIFSRALRQETLITIRKLLRPGGRLIVTVPNIARRFPRQQALAQCLVRKGMLEQGDIYYQRSARNIRVDLYYHLYSLGEFTQDLEQAGFRVLHLSAESILPESGVVRWMAARWLDRLLGAIVPLRYAYGFLAVVEATARPGQTPSNPDASTGCVVMAEHGS